VQLITISASSSIEERCFQGSTAITEPNFFLNRSPLSLDLLVKTISEIPALIKAKQTDLDAPPAPITIAFLEEKFTLGALVRIFSIKPNGSVLSP